MPRAMSIAVVVLIGGGVFLRCGVVPIVRNRQVGWRRWTVYAGSVLITIGAAGFFGALLSSTGGLNWLPKSFEWPVGYADGVVFTDSGMAVVPHMDSGRVQIYDVNWQYVGGWPVTSGGRVFRLKISDEGLIETIAGAHPLWHEKFDLQGHLVSKELYSDRSFFDTYPDTGVSVFVPTPFWLMPFTRIFGVIPIILAGMFMQNCAERFGPKGKARNESP